MPTRPQQQSDDPSPRAERGSKDRIGRQDQGWGARKACAKDPIGQTTPSMLHLKTAHATSCETHSMSNTVLNPTPNATVVLRGISIPLSSDVGGAFLSDCARNRERIFSDEQICEKYGVAPDDWTNIIKDPAVRLAVNAEHERRIRNGDAARSYRRILVTEGIRRQRFEL